MPRTAKQPPKPVEPVRPQPPSLLRMSPLRIGLTGTIGAMLAIGLAYAVVQSRSILILLAVALFIALGLNPAVELLVRRKVKRGLSVVIVFVAVFVVIGLAIWAVVPLVTQQLATLYTSAPALLESLRENAQIAALDDQFQIIEKAADFLSSGDLLTGLFGGIVGAGQIVVGAVFSGVTLLILTLYFLASLPTIKKAIYRLTPASRRDRAREIADQIFASVGAYLSAKFILVLIAGVVAVIFLWIIGLREYALALGVVIAILDFIPLVGQLVGAGVVSIVAFIESPGAGIATVIFFLIYIQVENYVFTPKLMQEKVDVPAAITIIAALLGGALLGMVGALLAIPVAAAVLLILREVVQPQLDAS